MRCGRQHQVAQVGSEVWPSQIAPPTLRHHALSWPHSQTSDFAVDRPQRSGHRHHTRVVGRLFCRLGLVGQSTLLSAPSPGGRRHHRLLARSGGGLVGKAALGAHLGHRGGLCHGPLSADRLFCGVCPEPNQGHQKTGESIPQIRQKAVDKYVAFSQNILSSNMCPISFKAS